VFLLPPIWTEHAIEGRCDDGTALRGGGWVPRNHPLVVSPPAEAPVLAEDPAVAAFKSAKSKKEKKSKSDEDRLESQLVRRVSVLKSLATAQETERKLMLKEEMRMRKYVLDEELDRCAPYIETQKLYAKAFGSLLQYIQDAPKVLSRLRFMMGFESGGGGLHAMCQDPSNYMVLDVLAVPILYPEDEYELTGALSPLIGKQNPNLIRIIDFSLHYARGFNASGFASIDDRIGIIVMERPASRTVAEYIDKQWEELTNDAMRGILLQVALALRSIHQDGGIHRNFYPGCVTIFLPEEVYLRKDNNSGGGGSSSELADDNDSTATTSSPVVTATGAKKATFKNEPVCKVGDYWFLHNPRTPGCSYSLGRADWGSRLTLPPEASQGAAGTAMITDKSDIYAFGICVLVWVTNGRVTQLPSVTKEMAAMPSFTNVVDGLSSLLPRRWGVWVHSLLKMCLQPSPKNRATSRDIVRFLSSSVGKK
jgi:serine/threonine protein kinase